MPHADAPVAIDDLLAHQDWVRRVARSLVEDAATADDVVQEAWLAALRRPPRDARSLRGWLAAVVRSRALNQRRAARRSATRDHAAPPRPPQPAPDDLVARAECVASVARAVTALPEPYRDAVLRRYFDDLPPREIARRTRTPVETVKSRIKRGLVLLRERLDDGDGQRAWAIALIPLAALAPRSRFAPAPTTGLPILGGILLSTTAKVVAAVAVLALIGVAWDLASTVTSENPGNAGEPTHATVARPASTPHDSGRHLLTNPTPPGQTPTPTNSAATTGSILVHVETAEGVPVTAAHVRLLRRAVKEAGRRDARRVGRPEIGPVDVVAEAESAASGAVTFAGVDAGTYFLDVTAPGRAGTRVVATAAGGAVAELRVVLAAGATLRCRVIDHAGRAVQGATVLVTPLGLADVTSAACGRADTGSDGRAEISGPARGAHYVQVRVPRGAIWSGGIVDVGQLGEHVVRLGPTGTLVGRVVAGADDAPVAGAIVGVRVEETLDPLTSGHPRRAAEGEATTDAAGAFRIPGLPAAYVVTVTVHAAGYVPYVAHSFPPGPATRIETDRNSSVDVRLQRCGTLRGTVSDDTGAMVEGARVTATSSDANGLELARTDAVHTDARGEFVLAEVVPGSVALTVAAPGLYAEAPQRVALDPGRDVRCDVRLEHGGTVTGTVRDDSGAPVADAYVGVRPAARPFGGAGARTDGAGDFVVAGVPPGEALVAWSASPRGYGQSAQFALTGRTTVRDVAIVVADNRGSIEGVVVRPDGGPVGGTRVRIARGDVGVTPPWTHNADDHVVGTDGTFRFAGIGPGRYSVVAWLPGRPIASSGPIAVTEREALTGVRVELSAGATIAGRVVDGNGLPCAGATVAHALASDGAQPQLGNVAAVTDTAGRFALTGLPAGLHRLLIAAEDHVVARVDAETGADEVEVRLRRGFSIEGRVEGSDGAAPVPLPRDVTVTAEDSGLWAHVDVTADGTFRTFPLDPSETYTVAPTAPGGYLAVPARQVRAGTADLVLRVIATLSIAGRVVDEVGKPMPPGVPVLGRAQDSDQVAPGERWSTQTRADGTFETCGVPGRRYRIVVGGGTSPVVPTTVGDEVAAGSTLLVLRAHRGVDLAGTIVDAAGNPVAGAALRVADGGARDPDAWRISPPSATADRQGRFRLRGLPPGPVELLVYRAGHAAHQVGQRTAPAVDVVIRLPD